MAENYQLCASIRLMFGFVVLQIEGVMNHLATKDEPAMCRIIKLDESQQDSERSLKNMRNHKI